MKRVAEHCVRAGKARALIALSRPSTSASGGAAKGRGLARPGSCATIAGGGRTEAGSSGCSSEDRRNACMGKSARGCMWSPLDTLAAKELVPLSTPVRAVCGCEATGKGCDREKGA